MNSELLLRDEAYEIVRCSIEVFLSLASIRVHSRLNDF